MTTWRFITNHGAVLSLVAKSPQVTTRQIASQLGITERSVLRIIADLEAEGYLTRSRQGRVNLYEVDHDLTLRRPELRDVAVGELLKVLTSSNPDDGGMAPDDTLDTASEDAPLYQLVEEAAEVDD